MNQVEPHFVPDIVYYAARLFLTTKLTKMLQAANNFPNTNGCTVLSVVRRQNALTCFTQFYVS
jgi:hypothetical protein